MKKFVMLMLVLGIASIANAGYSLVVSDGAGNVVDSSGTYSMAGPGTVWIGVYNDTQGDAAGGTQQNVVLAGRTPADAATWTGGNSVYVPPSIAGAANTYYGTTSAMDLWQAWHTTGSPTGYIGIGVLSEFELNVTDLSSDIYIAMWDSNWIDVAGAGVTLIPEPMTMVLLGLGGLFLRRRK